MPESDPRPGREPSAGRGGSPVLVPRTLLVVTTWVACLVVLGVGAHLLGLALARVRLLVVVVVVALLVAAVVAPLADLLRRLHLPPAVASGIALLVLLAALAGALTLVSTQLAGRYGQLQEALTSGSGGIRDWLVQGPLQLSATQVDQVRAALLDAVQRIAPSPAGGAVTLLSLLAGLVLTLVVVFLLLKNGRSTWDRVVGLFAPDQRRRVDAAGRAAWDAVAAYIRGLALVALVDAVGIGIGLVVLGVPLALPLALLIFLGAFVPVVGTFVAGAVSVVVALASGGVGTALAVLALVVVVQQLEGNVLYPVLMGSTLQLSALAVLLTVTAGTLLGGLFGTVVAIPLVAAAHRAAQAFRDSPPGPAATAPP
jgi:putative heme transporter